MRKHSKKNRLLLLRRQHGATTTEFVVVGPLLVLLSMAILQYGLLFFTKNQVNHAAFLAARAGSMEHANLDKVREAYVRGLVPVYGGGRNPSELAASYVRAQADTAPYLKIEMLNPTKESFDDFNDPALQAVIGKGKAANGGDARVINNAYQYAPPASQTGIKPNSGQTLQDANLLKLRITHGYEPKVPFMNKLWVGALKATDNGSDTHRTALLKAGRIPVVTDVVVHMQSDAIEPTNPVSTPGMGNNGTPQEPNPPQPAPPAETPVDKPVEPDSTHPVSSGSRPDEAAWANLSRGAHFGATRAIRFAV